MFTNLIAGALDAECEIVGVFRRDMIKYPNFIRRLKDIFNPSVEYNYIKSYNLPEIEARGVNTKEFRKKLLKLHPDIMLVGSWGEKFEKETFCIPKVASINAHPSLLPKYRGPNPYFWVIRNQEDRTGISFHLLDNGFDTGAILAQEEIPIDKFETGESLKKKTVLLARGVCRELLKELKEDIIIPLTQRAEVASYYSHPENLCLDFSKSADENYALIRAIHPWGEISFYHNLTGFVANVKQTSVEINKSNYTQYGTVTSVEHKNRCISVLCGDGKILKMSGIELLQNVDRPFTGNYISSEVKEGDMLI
jgi:methionyl-tRNA formyltransferase